MRYVLTRRGDGRRAIITRHACRRPLLNCGHARRVIIAILGCRMLLKGGMDGHLNPIHRSWWGVCLPGPRKYEIAHLKVLIFPEMTSVSLNGGEKSEETTYESGGLEAKSIR